MRDIANRLQFRPLFVAIACAFASAAHAQATATGTYQLGSDPLQSLVSGPSYSYYGVDVLSFPSSGNNSAGLHSYGSMNGNFGSRSSGYGIYDVTGSFRIVETFTNYSSTAQQATFNFSITPGLLQNEVNSAFGAGEYVSAGIDFNIQRNGSSVWGSSATLTTDSTGTTFNATGHTELYVNGGNPTYYSIPGLSQSVDLGVLGAGESLTLQYDLSTFAKGNAPGGVGRHVPEQVFEVPEQWVDFCSGGYGYGGYGQATRSVSGGDGGCGLHLVEAHTVTVPAYDVPGYPGGSHASSGDPFSIDLNNGAANFNGHPASFSAYVNLSPVPEPSTYALLMAGLVGVGVAAKRRKKTAA